MLDSDGRDATAVDVLFHPAVVRRALRAVNVTKEHFRDYLMDIATKNILEDHGIAPRRVEPSRWRWPSTKVRAERTRITRTHSQCSPRAKPHLRLRRTRADDGDVRTFEPEFEFEFEFRSRQFRFERALESRNATPASDARASSTRARSMKKGFLSAGGKGENAELYPDGSAEGIPKPGEQYDPLGHIPEASGISAT